MRFGPACFALALAFAGCSASDQQQARDDALVAQVQTKLASVDVDSTTSVQVSVKQGAVTLSGRRTLKTLPELVVKTKTRPSQVSA